LPRIYCHFFSVYDAKYAIFVADINNSAALAKKLIDIFNSPIKVNGKQLYVSAIGISLFPLDSCFY